MGQLLKRRIGAIKDLQAELDARVHRVNDLVTDMATIDGSAPFNDKYVGANALRTNLTSYVKISDIVNDLTTGGTTKPLSAEQGKELKLLLDGMAGGLQYKGVIDLTLPEGTTINLKTTTQMVLEAGKTAIGDFYKINGTGFITDGTDQVEVTSGDMIIFSVAVLQADIDLPNAVDKIDNTESADLLHTSDISSNPDLSVDPTKLAPRSVIKSAIESATAGVSFQVAVESLVITGDTFTLSHTPISLVVFNNEAIIDLGDSSYDTWEGVTIVGTTATLTGSASAYDGKTAKVTYLYL